MLTILDHVSLAQLRACKNRTSLTFALTRAAQQTLRPTLHRDIQLAALANLNLIDRLDAILDHLGRTPGPTQP